MTTAGFTSTTYNFTTNQCNIISLTLNDIQDVKTWNFWKQYDIQTIATGLQMKNITLEGIETVNPYTVMAGISSTADNGNTITLFGMKNTDLNGTWLIESFNYQSVSKNVVTWSLTLEKYYA